MEIISYKEQEMILLTDEEIMFYEAQKELHVCTKESCDNENDKNKFRARDYCNYTGTFRGGAHSICNSVYKVTKEIPVVIHYSSTYDYNFLIKQLAEEFKRQFECLGENTVKYITFSVSIKKENDNGKPITYKIKFIDSYRFMQSKLPDLVDKLSGTNAKEGK